MAYRTETPPHTHTEYGLAARTHDQPLGERRAASCPCPRGGTAGSGAGGPSGRGGEHTLHGCAADDGAEPPETRDGRGDLRGYHQLSHRDELSRGERPAHTYPRASLRPYVDQHPTPP